MNKYDQLLIQANENLRATDNKRDQIYYFFIVVLSLYLAFYRNIRNTDKSLAIGLNIFLIFLGITIIFAIINYQMWHAIYINTAIVIQKIINRDIKGPIDDGILNELVSETNDFEYRFFARYGTEFFIYNSFLIVNFMLFGLLIYQTFSSDISNTLRTIFIILIFPIYIFFFNLIRNKRLEKARKDFLKMAWILRL